MKALSHKLNNSTALLVYRKETFLFIYNTRHVKDDYSRTVQIAKPATAQMCIYRRVDE